MDEGSRRRVGLRSNCAAPRVQAGCILVTRFLSGTNFSFFVSENGKHVFKDFVAATESEHNPVTWDPI